MQNDHDFVWYHTYWEEHTLSSTSWALPNGHLYWAPKLRRWKPFWPPCFKIMTKARWRDGRAQEHRNHHSCHLLQKHQLVLQRMDQNNTLSLGVALFTDKRQITKLRSNAVQSPRKGKGREEVQEQKSNPSFFNVLVSAWLCWLCLRKTVVDTI